jgi:hypothetical protein
MHERNIKKGDKEFSLIHSTDKLHPTIDVVRL